MGPWKYEGKTLNCYGPKWSIYFGEVAKLQIVAPSVLQPQPGVSAHWDGRLMRTERVVVMPENSLGKHGRPSKTGRNTSLQRGLGASCSTSSLNTVGLCLKRMQSRGDLPGRVWRWNACSDCRGKFFPSGTNAVWHWEVWHSSNWGCVGIRAEAESNISVIVCVWSNRAQQPVQGCEQRSRLAEAMSQKNALQRGMAASEVTGDLWGSERCFC